LPEGAGLRLKLTAQEQEELGVNGQPWLLWVILFSGVRNGFNVVPGMDPSVYPDCRLFATPSFAYL